VLREAGAWLAPRGFLLIESGHRQSSFVARLMDGAGFAVRVVHDEELDGTAVVGQVRSGPRAATRRPWTEESAGAERVEEHLL
jgi:release factor glutamine methyltransferase